MILRRSFAVREDRRLPRSDPAAVWALVADLSRLEEWAPLEGVEWDEELPGVDQSFTARARLGLLRRRLRLEVDAWEAGHWYRLRVRGLPMVWGAELRVGVETERPDAPRLEITEGGETLPLLVPLVRAVAHRWARRALEGVGDDRSWSGGG